MIQIGQQFLNEFIVNEEVDDITPSESTSLSGGIFRTQRGFYALGFRAFLRPERFTPRTRTTPGGGSTIEITSASGALVGKIRTDVENSIVISAEFDFNKRTGCTTLNLKLNKLPDFPIFPSSIIKIKIADTEFNWFTGVVKSIPNVNLENVNYEYKAVGLADYLKGLKSFITIPGGSEIADVVRDIVQEWVTPFCPIAYNPTTIETSTGVITSNDMEFGKYTLDKIFDALADMANCYWGVNGDGEFYFVSKSDDYVKTFFPGYQCQTFTPNLNLDDVINTVVVARQESLGSGGVGWAIAGVFSDQNSIDIFGKRESAQPYQIPGYYSDADALLIGNNLIAEKAFPKWSAKATGFNIESGDDYWQLGIYRAIMPFARFLAEYENMQTLGLWSGTANITIDTDFKVYANNSISVEWSGAGETAILTKNIKQGKLLKIRLFIRADQTGYVGRFGCGLTNFDENLTEISIPVLETFYPFEWDIETLNLREINKFGFESDTSSGQIWLDKIEILCAGHQFYTIEFSRAKYTLTPTKISCDVEFGTLPNRMEDYFASLLGAAKELKYTQEVR